MYPQVSISRASEVSGVLQEKRLRNHTHLHPYFRISEAKTGGGHTTNQNSVVCHLTLLNRTGVHMYVYLNISRIPTDTSISTTGQQSFTTGFRSDLLAVCSRTLFLITPTPRPPPPRSPCTHAYIQAYSAWGSRAGCTGASSPCETARGRRGEEGGSLPIWLGGGV